MDYLKLTEYYKQLESTTKRLEKTEIISRLLRELKKESNPEPALNLLRGKVFPDWEERKIGVSEKLVIKALSLSTGNSLEKVEKLFTKTGDLGLVAEELTKNTKQTTLNKKELTIEFVFNKIRALAELEGQGTVNRKVGLISELLTSSTPLEARFIIRTILEQLRVGAAEGTIRDAIVWCFFTDKLKLKYNKETNELDIPKETKAEYDQFLDIVQHGYDLTNDYAEVFRIIKEEGIKSLEKTKLKIGKPINVMLFQKAENLEEAFKIVGTPAAIEFKYDGFRLQCHNLNGKIILYTRNLENVTNQFPDVIESLQKGIKSKNYILDAEVIGIDPKTKKWLSFQSISQRIKRKYNIEELAKKIPVIINFFYIIQYGNDSLLNTSFLKRRQMIEKMIEIIPLRLQPANQIITDNMEEAGKFYKKALELGNEGIMVKNLSSIYKPGSRVGYGVKVKPVLETLDLVIVKADYGEGKRTGWLTSFTVACYDKDKTLLEVGKVSTGMKEIEQEGETTYEEITKLLKPLIIDQNGKTVNIKPQLIIEVEYEEIQKSTEYSSGYALRFPRILRLRIDKKLSDINLLDDIKIIYEKQRSRNIH